MGTFEEGYRISGLHGGRIAVGPGKSLAQRGAQITRQFPPVSGLSFRLEEEITRMDCCAHTYAVPMLAGRKQWDAFMTERWGTALELWRYPVSSLRGERISLAELDAHGVNGDRGWGLVDADGNVAAPETERRWRFVPDMLARIGEDGLEVSVEADVWLAAPSDAADAAASRKAGFPVTFRPLAQTTDTATSLRLAPRYDRGHLHILTTASMKALAQLLPPESVVDVRRFRPNIVVDMEASEPGFPDRHLIGRSLRIGDAVVAITEPCERCSFTALAQGELPFAKEVLHAIARHGGGGFGLLGTVVEAAPIRQGDAVRLM